MADINVLLGSVMTFASLMAGISIAVERAVEIIKGAIPSLANAWPKNDQVRAGIVQLIAAGIGAGIASQMPDQVKNAMPPGLAGTLPLHWPTYAVLGLMASGGAGVWNHLLDILAALKTKQATLASLLQTTGVSASGSGVITALRSSVAPVSGVTSASGVTGASAAASGPIEKPPVKFGFAGASIQAASTGTATATPASVAAAANPAPALTTSVANPEVSTRSTTSAPKSQTATPSPAAIAGAPVATNVGRATVHDATSDAASIYPGRAISLGDGDAQTVQLIQHRLNQVGCGPITEDGDFDQKTKGAVELFQIRFTDHFGMPLRVDGMVGPLTWYSLFAMPRVPANWISTVTPETPTTQMATSPLLATTLKFAAGEVGVMEDPLGSNRGPRVDQYLRSVGIDPATGSYPWCGAFVYFCFQQAANQLGIRNPAIRTDGVLDHWNKAGLAGIKRLDNQTCVSNPSLVSPGMIFVIIHPEGTTGHTGLVAEVSGNFLTTIEGNTNNNGSREGIGVFRRVQRTIASINRGFICY